MFITLSVVVLIHVFVEKSHLPKVENDNTVETTRGNLREDVPNLYYYKHPYLSKAHKLNEEIKYDSAIYYYKEAAAKFEHEQQWQSYVWVNSYIGRLYLRISGKNYKDAFPFLQKAIKTGSQKLRRNDPYMAITLYHLGLYYHNDGNADSSLNAYNEALKILINNYGKVNLYTSDVHEAMGDLLLEVSFNNTEAEQHYLTSINIKEGLPAEQKDSVLTDSYYKLLKLYMLIEDFEKAQTYCYKAIQFLPYVKNHKLAWAELVEGVLADVYQEQHLYQKAIPSLKNAIRINNENIDGDKGYLSFYYHSLGDIYSKTRAYDSAIFFYKKSLKLTHDASLFENQLLRASAVHYSLGMTFLHLKSYPAALTHLSKCLNMRLEIYGSKHIETALAFQGIGNLYQESGLNDSALTYFQQGITACSKASAGTAFHAVPLVSDINVSLVAYQVIKDKAFVLKQAHNRNPADLNMLVASMAYYCLADTLMSLFGTEYDRETAQLLYAKNINSIYEEAIDCATELHKKTGNARYLDVVFNFMDKRKSRLLLGALDEAEMLKQSAVGANDLKMLRQLQHERTFLQSQLEEVNGGDDPDDHVLKVLHNRTYENESKIKAFKERLHAGYPYYASMQRAEDTVQLQDLQSYSTNNNALVLDYFWGDKAIYAIGIYKGKSNLIKMENKNGVEANIDTLKTSFKNGYVSANRNNDFVSFQNSSYYLYCSLVKPMIDRFQLRLTETTDKPVIIVIPDGLVNDLPFEALVTAPVVDKDADYRKLNYLIGSFAVSYNYSARLLLKEHLKQVMGQRCRVLGLSYSKDSPVENQTGKLHALRNISANELPGSAKELKSVSLYMDGAFYMGEEATEGLFKREAPNFDILHLALHGQADSSNSHGSRLMFKKGDDSLNDERLYAYEIYNIPIKARLAVLSACESGTGKLNPGEGMYSIARAFMFAGCPSVVMSFWKVNDNLTAAIIEDFYKQLSAGVGIDQSLRKAKLDYMEKADRRSAHPAYWAAFVAMGKMEPVINTAGNHRTTTPIAIILIGIGAYLIVKFSRRKRRGRKYSFQVWN